jgi:DNA-binding MarR family transcriptional regulator
MLNGMADEIKHYNDFPTPLLHLTYVLQQSSDELLESSVSAGLSSVRVMSALSDRVPRSQQVVAALLKQTESNISRQLKSMKKQGLVSVTKNKKDGRQKDVLLTQKGKSAYKRAEKLLAAQQKRLLSKKDAGSLEQLVEKMVRSI